MMPHQSPVLRLDQLATFTSNPEQPLSGGVVALSKPLMLLIL